MYKREEQLDIIARIGVTKEAYDLLRKQKRKEKLSLAKIASQIIIEKLSTSSPCN